MKTPDAEHLSRSAWLFETERFRLREITPSDAEDMYLLNADPEVVRYTGNAPFASVDETRRFIENYPDYRLHGMGRWAVIGKSDGVFVGWCGLKRMEEGVDVGYRFLKKFWGRGIATETARASIDYGFRTLGLERMIAHAAVLNPASIRVLEKIGMRRIGTTTIGEFEAIQFEICKGEWRCSS